MKRTYLLTAMTAVSISLPSTAQAQSPGTVGAWGFNLDGQTTVPVAAQSGVMNDVPPGEVWFGTPANPIKQQFRQIATLRRLAGRKEDAE